MSSFAIPLTREQLEAARARIAAEQNITLTGDEGKIEAHDCRIAFAYNGTALAITIEHKPWEVTQSKIESIIRGWFKQPA